MAGLTKYGHTFKFQVSILVNIPPDLCVVGIARRGVALTLVWVYASAAPLGQSPRKPQRPGNSGDQTSIPYFSMDLYETLGFISYLQTKFKFPF